MEAIREILSNPWFLIIWAITAFISEIILIADLKRSNNHLMPLMKVVWFLTVLYSSVIGLWVYFSTGRKQIPNDKDWRKSFRSVSHCYSGCGAGEVTGIIIAVGILALPNLWVAAVTFSLAYIFGVALTMGPLMQEGNSFRVALKDAIYSESASIIMMEAVAISADLYLAKDATMAQPLFWSSLIVSLSLGLFAAYPVNIWLIKLGVKEGMHDPRQEHHHDHSRQEEQNEHAGKVHG